MFNVVNSKYLKRGFLKSRVLTGVFLTLFSVFCLMPLSSGIVHAESEYTTNVLSDGVSNKSSSISSSSNIGGIVSSLLGGSSNTAGGGSFFSSFGGGIGNVIGGLIGSLTKSVAGSQSLSNTLVSNLSSLSSGDVDVASLEGLDQTYKELSNVVDNACGGSLNLEEQAALENALAQEVGYADVDDLIGGIDELGQTGNKTGDTDAVREENKRTLTDIAETIGDFDIEAGNPEADTVLPALSTIRDRLDDVLIKETIVVEGDTDNDSNETPTIAAEGDDAVAEDGDASLKDNDDIVADDNKVEETREIYVVDSAVIAEVNGLLDAIGDVALVAPIKNALSALELSQDSQDRDALLDSVRGAISQAEETRRSAIKAAEDAARELREKNRDAIIAMLTDLNDFGLTGETERDNQATIDNARDTLETMDLAGGENAALVGRVDTLLSELEPKAKDDNGEYKNNREAEQDKVRLEDDLNDLINQACRKNQSSGGFFGDLLKGFLQGKADDLKKSLFGDGLPDVGNLPGAPGGGGGSPGGGSSNAAAQGQGSSSGMTCELHRAIEWGAAELGMDPSLLATIIMQESGGDPTRVNGIGATGLIQFMPATAKGLGTSTSALKGMSVDEQMEYVVKYFKSAGWEPGETYKDIQAYTAVHGGSVNKSPQAKDPYIRVQADGSRKFFPSGKGPGRAITTQELFDQDMGPILANYRKNFVWELKGWRPNTKNPENNNCYGPIGPNTQITPAAAEGDPRGDQIKAPSASTGGDSSLTVAP